MRRNVLVIITLIYTIFTVIMIANFKNWSYYPLINEPQYGLETVLLDESPLYQEFEASSLGGIRLYLKNENKISDGYVIVDIGDAVSGEHLFHNEILVDTIRAISKYEYIDCLAENKSIPQADTYFVELYTSGCPAESIKTYIGDIYSDTDFELIHRDDSRTYSGKMLYFVPLIKTFSSLFAPWVLFTCLYASFMFCYFTRYNRFLYTIQSKERRISAVLILILIAIGLLCTETITKETFYTKPKTIALIDDELKNGILMGRWADFSSEFTVQEDDIQSIQIRLKEYPENIGQFVVVLKMDGQEDAYCSFDFDDMTRDEDGPYTCDVSDLGLQKGTTYQLDIFTGEVGISEEKPWLVGISVVYGERQLSILAIIVALLGVITSVVFAVFGFAAEEKYRCNLCTNIEELYHYYWHKGKKDD